MKSTKDKNGNNYQYAENDPLEIRIYTLENGLKIYLAQNFDQPRIQTYIPVRTGSANDPKENTGLAHYLEHLLFKGSSKIGTKNWKQEKILLEQISELYEIHKQEQNPEKKKQIYKQIDDLSFKASKFAIANEYDKLITSIGGKGTNAYTSFDETVYINNIPANEVEKWLKIESERFNDLVLRLFHTELETVYEEFNRAQDNDFRLIYQNLLDGLFPTHQYGQQTTLGKAEHLKNPSMKAIHKYFSTYYVPNNMAIIMVGDLEYETTFELIKKYFGAYKTKEIPENNHLKENNLTEIITKTIYSPSAESLIFAYRTNGINSKNYLKLELINQILFNGKAGLLDLNLQKKQKVLNVHAQLNSHIDYGWQQFYAMPKENQSLEEVKNLILEQIQKIKTGDFDSWIIQAVINDFELNQIKDFENPDHLAHYLMDSFIYKKPWNEQLNELQEMKKISKQELINFANDFYKDNYVLIYKKQGENKQLIKVENPKITPIEIDRESNSEFYDEINKIKTNDIKPKFVDYKELIKHETLSFLPFYQVKNSKNQLASLNFIIRKGSDHDRKFSLALNFIKYLGTYEKSADDFAQEFYKLGIEFKVKTLNNKSILSISGLSKNIPEGLKLMENLIKNVVENEIVYQNYLNSILKIRYNSKTNKNSIFNALQYYSIFGSENRLKNVIPEKDLKQIPCKDLINIIKSIFDYSHEIFYYGNELDLIKNELLENHNFGKNLSIPKPKKFIEQESSKKVFVVDYNMVQVEIGSYARNQLFDKNLLAKSSVLNEYFGSGLSSIVFQEIRESKSLAYSTFCVFINANKSTNYNYTYSFLGTQTDKLEQATLTLKDLMQELPKSLNQFENAKNSVRQNIASERFTKENIFWNYENLKEKGIDYDIRKEIYENINSLSFEDLNTFFKENISNKNYNYFIISNINQLDKNVLEKLGNVEILSLEDIFGY